MGRNWDLGKEMGLGSRLEMGMEMGNGYEDLEWKWDLDLG